MDVAATCACLWAPCSSISFGRRAADRLDLTMKGQILCPRLLQGLQFGQRRIDFVNALPETVSILVSSSATDLIQTEQWLPFYDIFFRNAFGSYLRVMRKVTFSPVMSYWLIHEDGSSVEYIAGSPSKTWPVKSCRFLFWV